jgi:hypothetical protein
LRGILEPVAAATSSICQRTALSFTQKVLFLLTRALSVAKSTAIDPGFRARFYCFGPSAGTSNSCNLARRTFPFQKPQGAPMPAQGGLQSFCRPQTPTAAPSPEAPISRKLCPSAAAFNRGDFTKVSCLASIASPEGCRLDSVLERDIPQLWEHVSRQLQRSSEPATLDRVCSKSYRKNHNGAKLGTCASDRFQRNVARTQGNAITTSSVVPKRPQMCAIEFINFTSKTSQERTYIGQLI